MKKFIVRVIIPDGKGKKVEREEVTAVRYEIDELNNLIFYDEFNRVVIQYHSYNYVSVEYPGSSGSVLAAIE